jgi:WXG100 family type VII secretion target
MELDGLRVDHAGLDRTADDLRGIVARIDARMQVLADELEPLRSQWVGDAQHAYTVAKTHWDGAIQEMQDLLRLAAEQVARSNAEYRAADLRGARSFGG